jgi:hypothetical protein
MDDHDTTFDPEAAEDRPLPHRTAQRVGEAWAAAEEGGEPA